MKVETSDKCFFFFLGRDAKNNIFRQAQKSLLHLKGVKKLLKYRDRQTLVEATAA